MTTPEDQLDYEAIVRNRSTQKATPRSTTPCPCGRKRLGPGIGVIHQEHLGRRHWRVHEFAACFETKDDRQTWRVDRDWRALTAERAAAEGKGE